MTTTRRRMLLALPAFAIYAAAPAALAEQPSAPPEATALAGKHPAEYYKTAGAMFEAGRKDEAVFVFYLGQLRYRTHLQARMGELAPDGDPALFGSLSEVVGRPLNVHAFGDIVALSRTLDAVLAYDAANPDPFTPPARFAAAHRTTRDGLTKMRAEMLAQAKSIRAQRKANGLENSN